MMIDQDNYRSFPAVSNSDLTWLQNYYEPEDICVDKQKAYRFGNLVDAIITEFNTKNSKGYFIVDPDKRRIGDVQYSEEEYKHAMAMKKAYDKDDFCNNIRKHATFQHITYKPAFKIEHEGFAFELPAKCKWDLFCKNMDMSGDIKSTAATTQKQFEEACWYFDYFRSRAWYMDLENRTNDILIGISKKNNQVFKIPIRKGDHYYNKGKEQYQELAFKYWCMFANIAA